MAEPGHGAGTGAGAVHDALMPPAPGGTAQGAALSLLVHGGLVAALAWGVAWRSPPPVTVSAELWAAVPQEAAPPAEQPPPPAPAPTPPPPPPAPAPAPPPPPPPREADIALEKARQQKAQQEKAAQEQAEKAAKADKAAKAEKAAREKAEKAERDKAAQEKQARDAAQRKREEAADEKRLAQQREENLKRMMGQIPTGSGAPGSRGTAAVDAAPSRSYAGLIVKAVKPNIVFTEVVSGNPEAVIEVRAAPTGTIIGRRLVKSSGSREWDEAVLRAIDRTGSLPKDTDGRVPGTVEIVFRPKD
jgi:colicin import membrane protein